MFIVWNAEIKPTLQKAVEWKNAMADNKYLVWLPTCQLFFNDLYEVEYFMGIKVRNEVKALKDLWYECK